jgi:hypothetical protein
MLRALRLTSVRLSVQLYNFRIHRFNLLIFYHSKACFHSED